MRLTVHLPRSLLNVRLHAAVNLARAPTIHQTTDHQRRAMAAAIPAPASRHRPGDGRHQPIEAERPGCWPGEVKSLTQNLIRGLQRTEHQRTTTQILHRRARGWKTVLAPYRPPRQPKLKGRLPDYGSANPLTCLVARAGIEPATFRFSDGLCARMELVFALVKLDKRPAFGRVRSVGPARWPHLGPIR